MTTHREPRGAVDVPPEAVHNAQDFKVAFGLGDTDKAYHPIDAHAVEMAAIKALYQRLEQQHGTLRVRFNRYGRLVAHGENIDVDRIEPVEDPEVMPGDAANPRATGCEVGRGVRGARQRIGRCDGAHGGQHAPLRGRARSQSQFPHGAGETGAEAGDARGHLNRDRRVNEARRCGPNVQAWGL